jgi:hypothetical protein
VYRDRAYTCRGRVLLAVISTPKIPVIAGIVIAGIPNPSDSLATYCVRNSQGVLFL